MIREGHLRVYAPYKKKTELINTSSEELRAGFDHLPLNTMESNSNYMISMDRSSARMRDVMN